MHNLLPKIKFVAVITLLIVSSYNITKTTFEIYKSSRRLEDLKSEVALTESENERLRKDLEYSKTEAFIEREARNKLSFIRPGETLIIPVEMPAGAVGQEGVLGSTYQEAGNVQKWLRLFF